MVKLVIFECRARTAGAQGLVHRHAVRLLEAQGWSRKKEPSYSKSRAAGRRRWHN